MLTTTNNYQTQNIRNYETVICNYSFMYAGISDKRSGKHSSQAGALDGENVLNANFEGRIGDSFSVEAGAGVGAGWAF